MKPTITICTLAATAAAALGGGLVIHDPIRWWTIDNGGGTSTNGVLTVSGTLAQQDASNVATSPGGLKLVGGFWGGFTVIPCGLADVGSVGGNAGADGLLDNNDFVVYINLFFASNPRADVGVAGGGFGSDGLFNNDDFVSFINLFFNGC